jgi:hypothetical protein
MFEALALISAINNLVASSFQNTGWAGVDGADSESGCNIGGLGSSFSDPCFTFSMDKKKVRIKQVLQQLKIATNNWYSWKIAELALNNKSLTHSNYCHNIIFQSRLNACIYTIKYLGWINYGQNNVWPKRFDIPTFRIVKNAYVQRYMYLWSNLLFGN